MKKLLCVLFLHFPIFSYIFAQSLPFSDTQDQLDNTEKMVIESSFQSLKDELKGPQDILQPLFPRKHVLIIFIFLFGGYFVWNSRKKLQQEHKPIPPKTLMQDMYTKNNHETGLMQRRSKIPKQDDPLFAESSEHVIRDYLATTWQTQVYHLTYQELLQLNSHQNGVLRVNMEALRRALMLLQRARYAKLDLDSKGLVEQMTILFEKIG